MKGDVIVEIAGQSITNIYDYTYALELLKVDQPVKVVYTRSGERRETQLTPAGRRCKTGIPSALSSVPRASASAFSVSHSVAVLLGPCALRVDERQRRR